MPCWMNHKLESRLLGEISKTSDDTTLMAESQEELKSLSLRVKEESEKAGLQLNILKPKGKKKNVITSTFSPSICHEVMGPDAMIFVF